MIYGFDIDGTICNNTEGNYPEAIPRPEVISKLNELYDAGHTIVMHTARGGTTGIDWAELTEQQLKTWNVKYHQLVLGKITADAYIDDKCIHVSDFIEGMKIPKGRSSDEARR